MEENVPRTKLSSGVYTSTEYPPEYMLSMHSEYAYSHHWPSRLYFCCITAPQSGGETPIADNREVLKSLGPEIVDEFRRKQVKYLRNLHSGQGFGLPWQTSFQTTDRAVVEEYPPVVGDRISKLEGRRCRHVAEPDPRRGRRPP